MLETLSSVDKPLRLKTARRVSGKVLAIWGSAGSGKSTCAVNLAMELALEGRSVLLIDLDTKSPTLNSFFGNPGGQSKFPSVLRLAELDKLNFENLVERTEKLETEQASFRFLPGIPSPTRWSEVTSGRLGRLLEVCRQSFDYTVLDLSADAEAGLIRSDSQCFRNEATNFALGNSDLNLVLFQADPIGVNRIIWQLQECSRVDLLVANFWSQSAMGKNGKKHISDALENLAQVKVDHWIPADQSSLDSAMLRGQPLWLASRGSKARASITQLAKTVLERER